MMKKILFILAFLGSPALAAETPATPSPVDMTFTLYAGGLKVVDVNIDYTLTPKAYDIFAVAKTRGFWSSLVPWRNMIKAYGTVDAKGLHPQGARYDDVWKEKARTTEFTFTKDGNVTAKANPPHKKDGRIEANEAQRKGAIDPLSAVVSVLAKGGAEGCQGKIPAYDGRRVYNLVLTNKGEEKMAKTSYNIYSGPAMRCEVLFEPVAGFPPKGKKSAGFWSAQDNADKRNPLIIWMAKPRADLPVVPIRVQSATEYGTLVAHLRAITAQPAQTAMAGPAQKP
jgi:hypothetical protein